jgi:hypothetical protein
MAELGFNPRQSPMDIILCCLYCWVITGVIISTDGLQTLVGLDLRISQVNLNVYHLGRKSSSLGPAPEALILRL